MTVDEMKADPSFQRHPPELPPPARLADWLNLANRIQAMPLPDLAKLDASTRESILIGLRTVPGPVAEAARRRILDLPKT